LKKIVFFRIDERLIHGQIVTSWLNSVKCDTIVVADDKATKDLFSKTVYSMAVPRDYKFILSTVDDAITYLKDNGSEDVFLIAGNIHAAELLINALNLSSVNLGYLGSHPGRMKYDKSLFLSQEDLVIIKRLLNKGIEIFVQNVSTERKKNINSIIK
jgi:PTS system mannose-specific IIB component